MAEYNFPDPPVLEWKPDVRQYQATVYSRPLPRNSLARAGLGSLHPDHGECSRQSRPGAELPYQDLWALYVDLYSVADRAQGTQIGNLARAHLEDRDKGPYPAPSRSEQSDMGYPCRRQRPVDSGTPRRAQRAPHPIPCTSSSSSVPTRRCCPSSYN